MRCENKPLLQDDAGFLQKITPIAVEVGLARTNRDMMRRTLRLSPGESTAFSCFPTEGAGGSSQFTGRKKGRRILCRRNSSHIPDEMRGSEAQALA